MYSTDADSQCLFHNSFQYVALSRVPCRVPCAVPCPVPCPVCRAVSVPCAVPCLSRVTAALSVPVVIAAILDSQCRLHTLCESASVYVFITCLVFYILSTYRIP